MAFRRWLGLRSECRMRRYTEPDLRRWPAGMSGTCQLSLPSRPPRRSLYHAARTGSGFPAQAALMLARKVVADVAYHYGLDRMLHKLLKDTYTGRDVRALFA